MLKQISKPIADVVKEIPDGALVLDVGGAVAPYARADYVIDYLSYDKARFDKAKGPGKLRVTKDTYVEHDICSREPWPLKDKQFDFVICSHTLEDIRDPIWVCSELIRVAKAGYIEVPSRLYETTFGIEMKHFAGNTHHRWLTDVTPEGALRFTLKHGQIHSRAVNKNRRHPAPGPENFLQCVWKDSFDYFEHFLGGGQEVFEYYLGKPVSKKEKWNLYRRLDPRNYLVAWLSYFKNTNAVVEKIFDKIRKQ